MKKGSSLNFLPDDAQKDAQEALSKTKGSQNKEIKLVIPKVMANEAASKKKLSFWERRKFKKQEKRRAALRKKGETAIQEALKTKSVQQQAPKAMPSQLFQDSTPKKAESKPVPPKPVLPPKPKVSAEPAFKPMAPKPKKKEEKKIDPKPVKPVSPKKEEPAMTFTEESGAKLHQPEVPAVESASPTVNLVPESVRSSERGQPWILAAIALLIVVAIWFVAAGITITHVKNVEQEVFAKTQELTKVNTLIKEQDAAKQASQKLQKQFVAVKGLIENHVYWSPFFQKLEETTIPDVYYVRINISQTGEVVLRAVAKSYAAAARQIRAFEKTPSFVDGVTVKEAVVELQPESILPVPIVAFDISLDLEDSLLKKEVSTQE